MKKVTWVGEDRMVPSVGIGTKGVDLTMPDDMADSYIKQGLAKDIKVVSKQTKKEIE